MTLTNIRCCILTFLIGCFSCKHTIAQSEIDSAYRKPPDETNFVLCEMQTPAHFIGGIMAWKKYLQKNIKYPPGAQKANIEGKILIEMVVGKDGLVRDAKVLKGLGGGLNEEALRVVKNSPKWKPAIQHGEAILYRFMQAINFSLQDDNKGSKHIAKSQKADVAEKINEKSSNVFSKTTLFPQRRLKRTAAIHNRHTKSICTDSTAVDYNIIFSKTERLARFPGGEDLWKRYVEANLKLPVNESCAAFQGIIKIQFVVNQFGVMEEVKALNDIRGGLADELVRVVKNSPTWIPAEMGGRSVKFRLIYECKFPLNNEGSVDKQKSPEPAMIYSFL